MPARISRRTGEGHREFWAGWVGTIILDRTFRYSIFNHVSFKLTPKCSEGSNMNLRQELSRQISEGKVPRARGDCKGGTHRGMRLGLGDGGGNQRK